MSEPKPYTFVISDESINSYGFRVLTDGIDFTQFKKNPIALWVHKRAWGWNKDKEPLPIGRWVNLRVENGRLLGDLEFDEDDDFAVKLRKKVDKKIINMVSPGLKGREWSDDPKVLIKGQTRSTLTKSILREISLVDLGSNDNALRLFNDDGEVINLSDSDNMAFIPLINSIQNNDDMKFLQQIAQVLKLSDNASEAEVLAAAQTAVSNSLQLTDVSGQVTTLTKEKGNLELKLKTYQDAEKAAEEQKRIDLVDGAIASKKITAEERDDYLEFAETNFELCEKHLGKIEGVKELDDHDGGEVKLSAWDARQKEINDNLKKK